MPDVQVPGVGQVPRKYALMGGAVVGGIAIYAYWKHRGSASSTATTPSTVDPNAVDPLTGLTYGAEQSAGLSASGNYVNPNPNASGSNTQNTTGVTTNSQWTQAVVEALGNLGYDTTFVSTTLGKYLDKVALSQDEASLVRTAWAYEGYPPQGPNSFTLTTTTPAPGTTPTANIAKRNGNLGVNLPSTGFHNWNDLARWSYWWAGHSNTTSSLNGYFGSLLAHANGQSGLSDPSKLHPIHLPDTLV